ncbi:unnamed protein product [Ceratitis capitata]|uniref:(Mediterranean fruit fly) hypothetical protein n=1 Tax=Ceratitis capitata TaxID=7213 RepID=A0A811U0R1_CERCA|nr:unnamed protein product [Ceratitis capitata]
MANAKIATAELSALKRIRNKNFGSNNNEIKRLAKQQMNVTVLWKINENQQQQHNNSTAGETIGKDVTAKYSKNAACLTVHVE